MNLSFFRRGEIKDVLAYLKLIVNDFDNNSLKRILKKIWKRYRRKDYRRDRKRRKYKNRCKTYRFNS